MTDQVFDALDSYPFATSAGGDNARHADLLDHASEYQERLNDEAVANRVIYQGESAEDCEECGDTIPSARRKAIPGVQQCVGCAGRHELHAKRYAR